MRFTIDSDVWQRFPGLRILLVWAEGIDNSTDLPHVQTALDESIDGLSGRWSHPNPQSHPYIAAWRDAIRDTGFSGKKFPSSIEALTRRVLGGKGLGSINPLVDFYNSVSLRHVVPAGGWDLDDLATEDGELRLRLAGGDERFRALGTDQEIGIEPGEAAYVVGNQVVTRHFVWRQSDLGKLTRDTRRALLISECLSAVPEEVAERVEHDLAEGLASHFGVEVRRAVASVADESEGNPVSLEISWPPSD